MLKTIVSGIVLLALVDPGAATEYWVVKSQATQKCVVVEQKPVTPAIRHSFGSRSAAEAAITRAVACGGVD